MFANRALQHVGSGVISTAARRFSTFFQPLPSVAIIGGGIGGLACANALLEGATSATSATTGAAAHRDIVDRVVIYEQADRFVPTSGAGFGFAPNGQICLASIGIPKIQSLIHPFDRLVRLDETGTTIRQSSDVLSQLRQRHGFGLAGCLRADLVDLLVQSLDDKQQKRQFGKGGLPPDGGSNGGSPIVQYSCTLTHIQQTKDKVELEFSNGHSDVVDLVVGADGIHTTVAKMLDIDHSEPLYSGANIFYGVIPDPSSVEWSNEYLQPDAMKHTILQSAGIGEFITFQVGPPDRPKLVWAATYASDAPPVRRDEWDPAQNVAELDDTILSRYPSTHPLHDLAANTHVGALLHFGMYYRKHKTTWYQNRVVLLGDSCHATLPYVGQGANQAIEDAIVLADCLAKHLLHTDGDSGNTGVLPYYERAYAEYYHQRFPRTKRIVDLANLLNPLYHSKNPIMPYLLDFVLGQVLRGGFLFRQFEKEIVEACPVKDYARYRP